MNDIKIKDISIDNWDERIENIIKLMTQIHPEDCYKDRQPLILPMENGILEEKINMFSKCETRKFLSKCNGEKFKRLDLDLFYFHDPQEITNPDEMAFQLHIMRWHRSSEDFIDITLEEGILFIAIFDKHLEDIAGDKLPSFKGNEYFNGNVKC